MSYVKRMAQTTRQGVRNLNGKAKNGRRVHTHRTCFHEFEHDKDCVSCWARNFGGYDDDRVPACKRFCKKCGSPER